MRHHSLWLHVSLVCALTGCNSGYPSVAPVSGTVMIKGGPLKTGRICFYPEKGRPALGDIASDGTFHLTTFEERDGATIGKHRVTIEAVEVIGAPKTMAEEFAQAGKRAPTQTLKWLAPERYSQIQSSDLVADVKTGTNQIDFNLLER